MRSLVLVSLVLLSAPTAQAQCRTQSGPLAATVVELYTSEGCNSCPPADRWLSTLQGRADVVPMAFHVDYWDRLGWRDRFADPAHTRRQYEAARREGSQRVYTPQRRVQGEDFQALRLPAPGPRAPLQITLQRVGAKVQASVLSHQAEPLDLALWWVATEDGHRSEVRSGENRGATLLHDFVVRDWGELPPLKLAPAGQWSGRIEPRPEAERPRSLALVVAERRSGRPLQALRLPPC